MLDEIRSNIPFNFAMLQPFHFFFLVLVTRPVKTLVFPTIKIVHDIIFRFKLYFQG